MIGRIVNVLLGCMAFAFFSAAPTILLSATILATQNPRRPAAFDDLLVVAYVACVAAAVCSVGFFIATVLSAPWKRLSRRRTLIYASVLGLVSPAIYITGLGAVMMARYGIFESDHFGVLVVASQAVPGVILGGLAHVLARIRK